MAASLRLARWKRRLLVLGLALVLLGIGLVALDGYIVHVACELDRIAYAWYDWLRGTDSNTVGELSSDEGRVVGFAFLPVDTQIVLGTWSHGLEIWDAEKGQLLARGPAQPEFLGRMACSADGKRVVSVHGLRQAVCVVWDLSTGTQACFPLDEARGGNFLALAPDGRMIAVVTRQGIDLYDVSAMQKVSTVTAGGYGPADRAVFAPDGRHIVFTEGRDIRLKQLEDGAGRLKRIGSEDRYIYDIASSPDGSRVAVAGHGFVALWDLDNGQRLYVSELRPAAEVSRPGIAVADVAFSPDAHLLAVSVEYWVRNWAGFHARRGSVLLFDAASGKQIAEWQAGARRLCEPIAFSSDGRFLAVRLDGKVRLLDVSALLQKQEDE